MLATLFTIVLAILLPPLAVWWRVGFSGHFWINLVLVLLFFVPAQIHALYVVLAKESVTGRPPLLR